MVLRIYCGQPSVRNGSVSMLALNIALVGPVTLPHQLSRASYPLAELNTAPPKAACVILKVLLHLIATGAPGGVDCP